MPAEATSSGVVRGEYASSLFRDFVRKIEGRASGLKILDLGPSTSANLMFWIDRGHPIGALNVARNAPDRSPELDYADDSVGGVVCWTALSHVSAPFARALMKELRRVLTPGGSIFAIWDGDGQHAPPALRYRILEPDRLGFEPISGLSAPRPVPTREIEDLFAPLRTTRIMVMRHGSREVLSVR